MLSDEKLTFLTQIAKGLAGQFGENCEVVIHQINEDNINNSIVSIENGHVSSRHLGDGPSQVVLEALKKDPSELNDHINYLTRTHDGRILKSSTMYFKDENGQLDGIFAINYDITTLIAAESNLKSLISTAEPEEDKDPDYIPQDVNELLDDLIHESVKLVGKPVPLMTKDDKIKCIQFLNNKGAFLVTLYSYIDAK